MEETDKQESVPLGRAASLGTRLFKGVWGNFPNKQMKLLLAWITIHEDELKANWELLCNGEGYFKIEPLR